MSTVEFSTLRVEGFTLSTDDATRHFEEADLEARSGSLAGSGTQHAIVLVSLGVDDYDCHVVQVDQSHGRYEDALGAVSEAIETLDLIRDQLAVMSSAREVRAKEKAAFDIGVDAQRLGLVIPSQEARA